MSDAQIKVAVCGCGRWGVNHVKTAYSLLGDGLVTVFDTNEANRSKIAAISPSIEFTKDREEILRDSTIIAIIVATPAETHFALTKEFLLAGKNVLVEKPITLHTEEARELIRGVYKLKDTLLIALDTDKMLNLVTTAVRGA